MMEFTVTLVRVTGLNVQAQFRGLMHSPTVERQITLAAPTQDILDGMVVVASLDGWQVPAKRVRK